MVKVRDKFGTELPCRTLLDTCSSANFITEDLAERLQSPRRRSFIPVKVLNTMRTTCKSITSITFKSLHTNLIKTLDFLVIPEISNLVPDEIIDRSSLRIPANIKLADPEFYKPAAVQMLIGTGATLSLFSIGQINLSPPQGPDLFLQKTLLGWVIGGSVLTTLNGIVQQSTFTRNRHQHTCHYSQVQFELERFWNLEEIPTKVHLSIEEIAAEDHFKQHIRRNSNGRYVVALPFNEKERNLGESYSQALRRFLALEHTLNKNSSMKQHYASVIQEYLDLDHMSRVNSIEATGFYLPHHAVFKETSQTTKLRVVFDGSAKSSTGISLNDTLLIGPTIQDSIVDLILRFRLHNYVLTGDIEKMYRQFLVRQQDRIYQRVLWRDNEGKITTYELNTVTFGLSAAPFLAIRCIQQLADDEAHDFPLASKILKQDLYVDDLITGAKTLGEALKLRNEIVQLLQRGGIHIRQWASNEPVLLNGLPEDCIKVSLQPNGDHTVKTLGVHWDSQGDSIVYTVKPIIATSVITKRTILSEIAKIFDPLGLLGPVIIIAKMLIQTLWRLKLNWDESVPMSIYTTWSNFCAQWYLLNNVTFPRRLLSTDTEDIQIHGFCDASEKAYGACIYLRSVSKSQGVNSQLYCAKSRVAPLKTVSLPRLELCGALLLTRLYETVIRATNISAKKTIFWTDSTITLNWINTQPSTLKTFVANRVAEIREKTNPANWRHVPSDDNPADMLSRGQLPAEFTRQVTWQQGPAWILDQETEWPHFVWTKTDEIPETKSKTCFITTITQNDMLRRYSTLSKLTRIVAYCLRFRKLQRFKGHLHPEELKEALTTIIRLMQRESFNQEIHDLKQQGIVSPRSKLAAFNPFLDADGILRVGGRLRNSNLSFHQKHPIVLPRSHHVVTLIIRDHHLKNLHAGTQSTLYSIRQTYWLLNGRNQVRKVLRNCVKCFRARPSTANCIMGDLPAARINESRPFARVGIDYCGPFFIKERKFRNRTTVKVYVAVFVCLVVKAVHLEVVSDMTTEAFIAALRRFISRRGKCQHIISDNGSNFIGANNELKELHQLITSSAYQDQINCYLANEGIKWTFSPPQSPNFGGLWEATVKSFKYHLKRVVGKELFTFEQFNTFVIQIEAVLNSRPITAISSDPNDLSALTPGHFLIGSAITDLPDIDFTTVPANRLSTWQHIQKVRRDFWSRWHKEYLNELNIRHKWTRGTHDIKEGTLVIIKEDNLPPLQWMLARVVETHPGRDGLVRTVTVKTASNTLVRNIRKLAPLPINQ